MASGGVKSRIAERRTARRFALSLPLAIFPLTDPNVSQFRTDLPKGRTRDISTSGIYFISEEPLAVGAAVAFSLILPSELTHGREVFVCAQGTVVRTEKKMECGIERTGVAARIERYEIVKDDPLYREYFGADPAFGWHAPAASL